MKNKDDIIVVIGIIIIYIILNSLCVNKIGVFSYKTTIIIFLYLFYILYYIKNNNLFKYLGFIKIYKYKDFLYYIPLIFITTINLWNGFNINNSFFEIIFYILTMICIGTLEEILFRGFLFNMVKSKNLYRAIFISSITLGFGHIINLINGASLIPALIQICYATVLGFLLVVIFYKGKSIYPCIITHVIINITAIFNISNNVSIYIAPIFVIFMAFSYAIYILNKKNIS